MNLHATTDHLTPDRMLPAHRHLVAKALSELAHELVLAPAPVGDGYVVPGDDPAVEYRFRARLLPLEHWLVDAASIVRLYDGRPTPLDAQQLVLDLRSRLGLDDETLPVYLEEIASTLSGHAWKNRPEAPSSAQLLDATFQQIESSMSEGHPCFLANNGRLGFGAEDYRAFAPETGASVRLIWLAVRSERSVFATVPGLSGDQLFAEELTDAERTAFCGRLHDLDLDPDDYHLMPCHPWQWENKIAVTFAPDVARRDIVLLGQGRSDYQAQQSIRTFFNTDAPETRYVKTALSVLNMGFMRGLSPAYMAATPAINQWVDDLVRGDEVLSAHGFSVLREVAAVGYRSPAYEQAGRTPYGKMLSALWRESPLPQVGASERLATMTSLLHVDTKGTPYVAELVAASGLTATDWVRRYLDAYLVPLLHCYYAHRLVFMPHGENVILVLENHVPTRVVMKDIGEEVALFDQDSPLPEGVDRIRADIDPDLELLSVFTDVFDCFLRFLAALLDEAGVLEAAAFWDVAASCARDYQSANPSLADRFAEQDLFAPTFARSCLNRLQLANNRQMVDLDDPESQMQLHGVLHNPIAHR